MKTIQIPVELHTKLKIFASEKKISITEAVIEILKKFFGISCILFMVCSCALISKDIAYSAGKGIVEAFNDGGVGSQDKDSILAKYGKPTLAVDNGYGPTWSYYGHPKCTDPMRYNYWHKTYICNVYFTSNGKMTGHDFSLDI